MKRLLLIFSFVLALAGCRKAPVHPEWTYSSVMYEVNIRQFSPEGTFRGVEAQLPRLKELGVDRAELISIAKDAIDHNWFHVMCPGDVSYEQMAQYLADSYDNYQ